jgi:dipeptidase E
MRLFLSSQDLGHHAELAHTMCAPGMRVAFIINAMDYVDPAIRLEKVDRKRQLFEDAGFHFDEVDLRDYFGKPEQLEVRLQDFDFAWCSGGNTFILRRAMRASGFDDILLKRLQEDSIMYGGSSAGSCVAAPSLHGIERGDRPDPDTVPADYPDSSIIWDGLNLVPFMMVPHCDQEWFSSEADATVQALQATNTPHELLNDGEVVIVDGDDTRVLRPNHEHSRYEPISQKPYCCVPTCLQIVLQRNGLPKPSQEEIGIELGLVVPPEYADEFENVTVRDEPIVSSGFGTRIQDPNYSVETLIEKKGWPFSFSRTLATQISDVNKLRDLLTDVESRNADALICYQNDRGYGHVVVFDRLIDNDVWFVDPSPNYDKWRSMSIAEVYKRIQAHGDVNSGGIWHLEKMGD